MTTPDPELRELAAHAVETAGRCLHPGAESCEPWWIADAVLAAVEPVIRRQERAATADEIANDLSARANADDLEYWGANEAEVLRSAAAIARSHSRAAAQHPTEEEKTRAVDTYETQTGGTE